MTTHSELPDEHEQRDHDTSLSAWSDYWGRILELEIHGYTHAGEDVAAYGRRWVSRLSHGIEQISVTIERDPIAVLRASG